MTDQQRDLVFLSYSRKDPQIYAEVRQRLIDQGLADRLWDDTEIRLGERWDPKIQDGMDRAAVAVLILSDDYFGHRKGDGEYILERELPYFIERWRSGELDLLPVYWRPSPHFAPDRRDPVKPFAYRWDGTERQFDLHSIQALPRGGCLADAPAPTRRDALLAMAAEAERRLAARLAARPRPLSGFIGGLATGLVAPMTKLFLSHSTADDIVAGRLRQALADLGQDVWIDARELRGGDPVSPAIRQAIEAAAAYAVLVSPAALQSRWIADELAHALEVQAQRGREHYPVILLSLDGTRLGVLKALFGEELTYIPISSASGGLDAALNTILVALGHRLSEDVAPYPKPPRNFPRRVYIGYSHSDEAWTDRIVSELGVLAHGCLLRCLDDLQIAAGPGSLVEIEAELDGCAVALLLISADFLTSRFILDSEVPRLLQRRAKGGLRVIPILLRPCAWERIGWLSALKGRPIDGRALSGMSEHDAHAALAALALEIADLVAADTTDSGPQDAMGPEMNPDMERGDERKIFICYRREDSGPAAGRIYDRLEAHFGRGRVFMDVHDLPLGVDWRDWLDRTVRGSELMLVVIGRDWLRAADTGGGRRIDAPRDYVRTEIEIALRHGIPLIPVLLEGVSMPLAPDIPKSIKPLTYCQAATVHAADTHFRGQMDRLIRGIERLLAHPLSSAEGVHEVDDTLLKDRGDGNEQRNVRDKTRHLLSEHRYAEAIEVLNELPEPAELGTTGIESEFGFLFRLSEPHGGPQADALGWCTRIWRVVAAGNADALPPLAAGSESSDGTPEEEAGPTATTSEAATKQETFDLTDGFARLLGQFFVVDTGQERELPFDFDQAQSIADPTLNFAFDAVHKEMPGIRCHVEFINRSEPLTSQELASKWQEAAVSEPRPDHWVLISPRADPDAELQRFLEAGRARSLYGFQVLIWGPASGVRDFFGLEPSLFEQFFPAPETGQHPRDWGSEQRARVLDRFNGLLQTTLSLPEGWDRYVEHPEYLCFTEDEQMGFAAAYPGRVRLKLLSRDGTTELPKTAEEFLIEDWLDAPKSPRCCFLLSDFGDGKSFLTYTLARELLQRFRHSPRTGTLPLRLALREFDYQRTTPRDFLHARVERFGAEIRGWETIKHDYRPPLAILDGFDEISNELDPRTVSKNIDALLKCWDAPVFDRCKILITSRMHFFESRDAQRLLSRLENPVVYRLARIPRHQVRQHLSQGVEGDEQRALLRRIETMHDPIGLASKPLFYQMVKETLNDLPQDPDEASIYESYVQRALRRKWELLDDPDHSTANFDSILEGIWAVLGRLAEELQSATQTPPCVSLKALAEQPGMDLARVLWNLSAPETKHPVSKPADREAGRVIRGEKQRLFSAREQDLKNVTDDLRGALSKVERGKLDRQREEIEQDIRQLGVELAMCDACLPDASPVPSPLEQDALARVGARSLLTRVGADHASGKWLVDFCHRSVREFFVARQLLDALKAGPEAAVAFFERVPVSWEILFFAGRLLRRGDPAQWIDQLLAVLACSRIETDTRGFGGSVLTLLAGLSPRLPDGFDYRGRSYELADLQGADLSNRDFSGSRFRRANLANANLTGADLSRCDLTGVRLDETAGVRALAASAPGERVLAAYEDGSVWEWNLTPGERQDYGIVFAEQGLRISRFGRAPAGIAWALAERRLLLFDVGTDGWVCMARIPLEQASNDLTVQGSAVALLGSDGGSRCRVVDLDEMVIGLEAPMPETSVFTAVGKEVLVHRVDDKRLRLAARGAHAALGCEIPCLEATCVSLLVPDDGAALVAWGQANGQVRLARVRAGATGPEIDEVFAGTVHAGPVTSLVFLSEDTLVSGGVDRKIVVSRIMASGSSPAPVPPLVRNLECKGLRVDGLVPEDRRQRLAALIAHAETGPGLA